MQRDLRIANEADAQEITSLVNRAYRPQAHEQGWTHEANLIAGPRTTTEQIISLFTPNSYILVLSTNRTIRACVHVQAGESFIYIGMLATDPAMQNLGLGKQMLAYAESFAEEHFNAKTYKMSVLSSRPELLAFYERRGYERTGEVQDYPVASGVGAPRMNGLHVIALTKKPANRVARSF